MWAEWTGVIASLGWLVATDLVFCCRYNPRVLLGARVQCWILEKQLVLQALPCFPAVLLTPVHGIPVSPSQAQCFALVFPEFHEVPRVSLASSFPSALLGVVPSADLVRGTLCLTPRSLRHPLKRVSPRADSRGTPWSPGGFLDLGILYWGILGEESYWDIAEADEGQES